MVDGFDDDWIWLSMEYTIDYCCYTIRDLIFDRFEY
jgi:hypothetical protein